MGMRCHYEVLALERDAAAGDVKKAFHKQALKWHPDKHQRNGISPEQATQRFQEIQNAYEVLSDPHERKWYDEHREQILRGDDGGDGESENELNLFKFFGAAVYSGFGDDEKSFYNVYGALFEKIDTMDVESVAPSKQPAAPVLGNNKTSVDDVNEFYRHWGSYVTQRTFAWVDEYKTTDAPTRQIRRAMEKENKKLRDAAKKAFTNDVRELVEFVKKRDPRMIAYLKKKEKEREEQLRAEEQRKKEKQAAYEAQRLAFQQQERERWEKENMATSRLAEDHIQEEMEKLRKKMDAELLLCEVCNKTFKSAKQLDNHLTSKKHKDREIELGIVSEFSMLEDELDRELQEELAAMKLAKKEQQKEETMNDDIVPEDFETEENEAERAKREAEAESLREKERVRLEKDQKAADKRKERKDARKAKKKEEVEKIVTAAKKKELDELEEEERGKKGKRGQKKKR